MYINDKRTKDYEAAGFGGVEKIVEVVGEVWRDEVEDGGDLATIQNKFLGYDNGLTGPWHTWFNSLADPPEWELIYYELLRGTTHYATELNVVRRMRTSDLAYQFRRTILSTKYIYTSDELVSSRSSAAVASSVERTRRRVPRE